MNVLYSQLKKYLPDLKATPKEVAAVYTLTGYMLDKWYDVKTGGVDDVLMDLEVRQNRADSFGVWGLARELSAYYNIALNLPKYEVAYPQNGVKLPIEIKAKNADGFENSPVKRVMAIKISNLKVSESPEWLKNYLSNYGINSVNNLVDITNYVMVETSHPSHAFDLAISGENLIWEINPGYKKFTTLNGEELELSGNELMINNSEKPLSLSFIGGKECGISMNTKDIIIEIGIYDGGLVRRNSRDLKTMTEAGGRLEKFLDPETIPQAFEMLVSLILENCGGEIASELFDEYVQPTPKVEIKVDLDKVSQIAGIEITYDESKTYLSRLGFQILSEDKNILTVLRPVNRLDIEIEEDCFEEIIRLKGFDKIPTNVLNVEPTKDITPSRLKLHDKMSDILVGNGFDEVRSWVLVGEKENQIADVDSSTQEIFVTNSINEEVPALRKSISISLINQIKNYLKLGIPEIKLFEIGKIFYKKDNKFAEDYDLAMVIDSDQINEIRKEVEILLRSVGLADINYLLADQKLNAGHPQTTYDILVDSQKVGVIYITKAEVLERSFAFAEINLDKVDEMVMSRNSSSTYEVNQKIVQLDSNIESKNLNELNQMLLKKVKEIGENYWNHKIIDSFKKDGDEMTKYTVRVAYVNLSDTEAKEMHARLFD